MDYSANWFLAFMFFWLLILTVAFVIHWIKIERHHEFDEHLGLKVPSILQEKILGRETAPEKPAAPVEAPREDEPASQP